MSGTGVRTEGGDLTPAAAGRKGEAPVKPRTMSELSALTGISRVTISKVLNGRPGVRAETRRRVLEACRAYDFQANAAAQSLVRQKTGRIGIVLTGLAEFANWSLKTWYVQEYLRGVLTGSEEVGLNLIIQAARSSSDLRADPSRIVRRREADAILLIGSGATGDQVAGLIEHQVPFAILGASPPGVTTNVIYYDNRAGVHAALAYLWEIGHREIAFVGRDEMSVGRVRFAAFREFFASGQRGNEVYINRPLREEEIVAQLLSGGGPTAALCFGGPFVDRVLTALADGGRNIPRDLSIICFDDAPSAQYRVPPLSVLRQPLFEIGRRAVHALRELLDAGAWQFPSEQLPMELVVRESVGLPRQVASSR